MLYNSIVVSVGCALALTYATPQPARPPPLAGWDVECIQNRYHQCFLRREALDLTPAGTPDPTLVSVSRVGQQFYLIFSTPKATHSVLTVVLDDGRVEKIVKTGCTKRSCTFGGLFDWSLGEKFMRSDWIYVAGEFEGHPDAQMLVNLRGLRAAIYGLR